VEISLVGLFEGQQIRYDIQFAFNVLRSKAVRTLHDDSGNILRDELDGVER
jgi:hypothetical protein